MDCLFGQLAQSCRNHSNLITIADSFRTQYEESQTSRRSRGARPPSGAPPRALAGRLEKIRPPAAGNFPCRARGAPDGLFAPACGGWNFSIWPARARACAPEPDGVIRRLHRRTAGAPPETRRYRAAVLKVQTPEDFGMIPKSDSFWTSDM